MTRKTNIVIVAVLATGVMLTVGGILVMRGPAFLAALAGQHPPDNNGAAPGPAIGGPFTLVAADGQTVTDKTYRGKWLLVYFGYTFCPDVCPTTLGNIAQALAKLGPEAEKISPLFITVDPKRDTPKVMGNYVKSFDPRIIGLSGSADEIAAVTKEYHVYAAPQPGEGGNYLVDHSSFIYLMTPQGAFAKVMPGNTMGAALADQIGQLVSSTS